MNDRSLATEMTKDNGLNFLDTMGRGMIPASGLPVIHAHDPEADTVRCSFIFFGDETTESVHLHLPPYSRLYPDKYRLSRLGAGNVWLTSVDLPSRSRFLYGFVVNVDPGRVAYTDTPEKRRTFRASMIADPYNANRLSPEDNRSILEMPLAKSRPKEFMSRIAVSGDVVHEDIESELLGNTRKITVFVPDSYAGQSDRRFAIFFDREIYLNDMSAIEAIDRLIVEALIEPVICIFVGNANDQRETELPCNDRFAAFVHNELLPCLKRSYSLSSDPKYSIIGGASYGGLAASYVALSYPQTFGNVLSQSGSYWWNDREGNRKIMSMVSESEGLKGMRFYLDAGSDEIEKRNGISLLEANRQLQELIVEKEGIVHFREFYGSHGAHNWRETLPEALIHICSKQN